MEKKKDPYMQEAYDMLEQMSADERKRLEYEAREKAIRDYNTQMYSVRKQTSLDKGTQRKTTENELPSLTQCTA